MSEKPTYDELVSENEMLGHALHKLVDRQEWNIIHMGGTYYRAVVILTPAEYAKLQAILHGEVIE